MPASPAPTRPYRLGIDIGGTFTDFVLLDDRDGRRQLAKVLTTPDDPARAVREGLARLTGPGRPGPGEIEVLIHGTTLVINALIERRGARTALLTTRGFRDSLQLAREYRYDIYDLNILFPEPLVPRRWRFELGERVLADGRAFRPLDEAEVRAVAARLLAEGIESVAVCLLHAYRAPEHELRVRELLAEAAPGLVVTLSHEVLGQIREYERAVLAAMNAYVRPTVGRYLERIEQALRELEFAGRWYVMASNGGLLAPAAAAEFPVRMLESGPVAGALAAAHHGRELGEPDLVAFDMGGTTAKACLVTDGAPSVTTDYEVARVSRFLRGSGLPVKLPVVDMIEIGAGGGSIAARDALGLLSVGPRSAGADPGPACYGRGGGLPTVTDANLVLGYLDPGYFLGGELPLDAAAAERALAGLGAELGLSALEAARGVHEVVTSNMAEALRTHAAEKGGDLRRLTLVAFGGAGPLHAYGIARALRIRRVLFPRGAGVFAALGFLTAPLSFDLARSAVGRLAELEVDRLRALYADLEARGLAMLALAGVGPEAVRFERSVDMRYAGQGFEITVPLPDGLLERADLRALARAFDDGYRQQYGRTLPDATVQEVTWRCSAVGPRPAVRSRAEPPSAGARPLKGRRPAFDPRARALASWPVYDRYALEPGAALETPALVEERECTILLGPDSRARVDPLGNLILELEP